MQPFPDERNWVNTACIFAPQNQPRMKLRNLFGITAAFLLVTGCSDDTTPCDEGNKAVITVINNSPCTPDVSVGGDEIATDMGILASQSVEVDAGDIDVEFSLALISLCTAYETTVTVACGDSVTVEFTGE